MQFYIVFKDLGGKMAAEQKNRKKFIIQKTPRNLHYQGKLGVKLSYYIKMVPKVGFEPTQPQGPLDFESNASASSATSAYLLSFSQSSFTIITQKLLLCKKNFNLIRFR